MRHIVSLVIKFVLVALVLEVVLLLTSNLTFEQILFISVIVTAVAYFLGDLFILPATSNMTATLADIGLALVSVYIFNFIGFRDNIPFLSALLAAVILGVLEWFFHRFLSDKLSE